MDRQFRAFDTRNGEVLWQTTLPVDATANDRIHAKFEQPVDSLLRVPFARTKLLTH